MITCHQCRFYGLDQRCHRRAPSANESGSGQWPFISQPGTDWCGEAEERPADLLPATPNRKQQTLLPDGDHPAPKKGGVPPELTEIVDWWNNMHAAGIVATRIVVEKGSGMLLKLWDKRNKPELRAVFRQYMLTKDGRDVLARRIADQNLGERSWFGIDTLFTNNKDGIPKLQRIIENAYRDFASPNKQTTERNNAQVYNGHDE